MEPTNARCLRGLAALERDAGRATEARDYLERALDLEPENARCVSALAKLEEACGNHARAARYYNAAKQLRKENRARRRAEAASEEEAKGGGGFGFFVSDATGTRGTWDPSEAAAAARHES